ncbi:MAG TPA: ThiF family adenylyltransferase [Gemmatimonadaceae bacterium]
MATLAPQSATTDRRAHALRPVLLDAAAAHANGWVRYSADATAVVSCDALASVGRADGMTFHIERQYPAIRATFDDLNKALSALANSPRTASGKTLREEYETEVERYETLVGEAMASGKLEPDYGTYVVDHAHGDLYLVAPERWHRLALVTSNSKLVTDPERALSWSAIRERLENAVVGFLGVSVGGNLLEGWLREARPRRVKIADPDWVELTNFNRGERMSLRHAVAPRSARFDPTNAYDIPRVAKAEYIAYEQQLVDPYLDVDVYNEGINRENLERFFGGGDGEPAIDILVEEMDNLDLKILVRQIARERGIDVVMLSDFGHQAHLLWHPYSERRDAPLGHGADDTTLLAALAETKTGNRAKVFEFVGALCGADFARDQFAEWIAGRGEQPTGSLPQSGATAMASGAIGGKEIALRVLGQPVPPSGRIVYDLLHRTATP